MFPALPPRSSTGVPMYARSLLARGWLACLLAFASGLVLAADCPAGIDGWPNTDATQTDWNVTGIDAGTSVGGYVVNSSHGSASGGTLAYWRAEMMAALESAFPSHTWTEVAAVYYDNSPTSYGVLFVQRGTIGGTDQYFYGGRVYRNGSPSGSCDSPVAECGSGANTWYFDQVRQTSWEAAEAEIGQCYNGCAVEQVKVAGPGLDELAGTYSFPVNIKTTGDSCSGGGGDAQPPSTPAAEPEGEICITSANGVEYCHSGNYGENCGYVNDKFTCLGKTDSDECWVNDDGSRLCGESAPVPPVPDNGTPGVKAAPDDTVKASEGIKIDQVFNYYNTTSVANSSRPPGDSGANPNRPSSQNPGDKEGVSGGGGMGGEGSSASGGADCSAAPACSGDPVACAVLAQQWRTRCVDNPSDGDLEELLGAVDDGEGEIFQRHELEVPTGFDQAGWMGAGSCFQDYTLNLGSLLGTVEIPFSEWCWLLEVIGVFVMIAAYVSAARIFIGGL